MKHKISNVSGRMVFDSRGIPTVEAEIKVEEGTFATAIAPSGASKGKREAFEKRDGFNQFNGLSVIKNIELINKNIKMALKGIGINEQSRIDKILIELDGTKNKKNLGANTTIAVSMAAIKLAALCNKMSLWEYLNLNKNSLLPLPQVQVIGGGAHAQGSISLQDFLIIPNGAENFKEALEWIFKVYTKTRQELARKKLLFGVADEGGFWPPFSKNEDILSFLTDMIFKSGFEPFKQISLAIDIAANNFRRRQKYKFHENEYLKGTELLSVYMNWINKYPIISIEDPFAEEDFLLFRKLKEKSPSYMQIVGDDLVVTSSCLIKKAKLNNSINSVLIKPNQVGTITETKDALHISKELNLMAILSARSGETEDTTISDLSVGWSMKQLKVGSFSRSERLAKWNQCLRIGEKLNNNYLMHDINEFKWKQL